MSTTQLQERPINHLQDADADLLLRLRIALSVHKRAGWHLVRFAAQNGVVQLAGVVPTFYDRQLIAALVRHVAGVFGIEDNLAVGDPSIRQQVIECRNDFPQSDLTDQRCSVARSISAPSRFVAIIGRHSGRTSGKCRARNLNRKDRVQSLKTSNLWR